jgi:hypothetical protein
MICPYHSIYRGVLQASFRAFPARERVFSRFFDRLPRARFISSFIHEIPGDCSHLCAILPERSDQKPFAPPHPAYGLGHEAKTALYRGVRIATSQVEEPAPRNDKLKLDRIGNQHQVGFATTPVNEVTDEGANAFHFQYYKSD